MEVRCSRRTWKTSGGLPSSLDGRHKSVRESDRATKTSTQTSPNSPRDSFYSLGSSDAPSPMTPDQVAIQTTVPKQLFPETSRNFFFHLMEEWRGWRKDQSGPPGPGRKKVWRPEPKDVTCAVTGCLPQRNYTTRSRRPHLPLRTETTHPFSDSSTPRVFLPP